MAHYTRPICKLCRQMGEKLFLKGEKCDTKCTLSKRTKKTFGAKRTMRKKQSEYGKRFKESQKLKYMACLSETQLRNYYRQALKMKGAPGKNLLLLIELRLDNILRKMGITPTIKLARQLITHGHVLVNNKKLDTNGYRVKVGDKIAIKEKLRGNPTIKRWFDQYSKTPSWIRIDKEKFAGEVITQPTYEDISYPVDESLIVELYSR